MNASLLLAPLLPVAGFLGSAFSNPGGLLALCVTRRQRYEHRQRLAHRRFRSRPRSRQRSSKISPRLRRMVERGDRRQCVYCGARQVKGAERFPVDHMTPWIMGGLTCLWNCALLCKACNSVKSCYWVAPGGRVYYRGRREPPPQAALILAAELVARRSVRRWLRAYGAGW